MFIFNGTLYRAKFFFLIKPNLLFFSSIDGGLIHILKTFLPIPELQRFVFRNFINLFIVRFVNLTIVRFIVKFVFQI